jgi:ABC-type transporter Mla subunit MlaD
MANALCLMMPVIPGTNLNSLAATLAEYQTQINAALTSIGTVHFARFALFDRSQPNLQPDLASPLASNTLVIGVITEYDGDFNRYIGDFSAKLGEPFDALLKFVVGGAAIVPVNNNLNAFQAFIKLNDASQHLPNTGLYSAYPQTVQQILAKKPA